jgi:predicted RNA-binding protein (virulence factor B family)
MVEIGKFNKLRVIKEVPFGVYLKGGHLGEILLPNKFKPKNLIIDDLVDVFIYFDSEDKIIATTKAPLAQIGDFAFLRVIDVNPIGAFLNWGLEKDLLVPRAEQHIPMEQDRSYIVYIKQDNQGRIIASSKVNFYLDRSPPDYQTAQEVDILVESPTPLGTKVIINNTHWGLIHSADIFQKIYYGQRTKAYIKTLREDGKIDVTLRKAGQDRIHDLAARILNKLHEEDGYLPLHDKSPTHEIMRLFGESKKGFKSAIGQLYKQGDIVIEADGIRLQKKTKL